MHHHFAPPAWVADVKGRPLLQPANTRWTPEQSIDDMDKGGVAAAVVSITNPGLWFGDLRRHAVSRARAMSTAPSWSRIIPRGSVCLPPSHCPTSTQRWPRLPYAYDTLKTDGMALFTSYGDKWLGNPAFRPVMEELNRRKAVVAVHPTAADCCRNLAYAPGVGPGSIEYGTDTTRAIMGVAFSGDAVRFPDIRFIWSHAGGTVPFLAGRIEGAASGAKEALPNGFAAELKKFYYDVAGATNRGALASLLQLVAPTQIVFGTDFPPGGTSAAVAKALADVGLFSESDLRAIDRGNAVRLLPRFAA